MTDHPLSTDEIVVAIDDAIAWVTLNRPAKLNAVHQQMAKDLLDIGTALSLDNGVHVVVVSGAGERAFCVGSDIAALPEVEPDDAYRVRALRPHAYPTFASKLVQPVIAMIDGYCLGGGMELALHCDIRVASTRSVFATPEIKWGWLGGGGASQLLPRLIGAGHTMQMLASGENVDAQTALRWGLVDDLVEPDDLRPSVAALATSIATKSPAVAQAAKRAVRLSFETGLTAGTLAEQDLVWATFQSPERTDGVQRFTEGKS